ncbi:kanamycin nucleotidyltransferase C-terminal domain-containing protein [Virgibacillus ihumii]|uniref:kanamycin nucleotidyltransferase C-terminal domain-containing protein n=1 Tax=Virgibacillus ihumii TaxID=2686091 RepID=UPI00157BD813|nr:kanamycin nucleotidyltransferase C-terminal domain-containing protein [Virgibacillus ihumii]
MERLSSKANSIDYEWPVKGDTIFTSRILYDPKNIYGQLTKQARKTEESVDFNDFLREALADMYEHVYKVFILTESNTLSVADESRQIAYWAAICVALKNKVRYLSSLHYLPG